MTVIVNAAEAEYTLDTIHISARARACMRVCVCVCASMYHQCDRVNISVGGQGEVFYDRFESHTVQIEHTDTRTYTHIHTHTQTHTHTNTHTHTHYDPQPMGLLFRNFLVKALRPKLCTLLNIYNASASKNVFSGVCVCECVFTPDCMRVC